MDTTTLTLHTDFGIGEVDRRIFGGFVEHMGRCVYEGLYDPDSIHADGDGIRADVADALRRLDVPVVRYPGGNFVSGYHWMDGVGPQQDRPTLRELAWQSIEPNSFGTDEFISLSDKLGWTPMMSVNLGTGTPEEARNWVEYCNSPAGTRYADMRVANGNTEPFNVPLWCLGNEMDGPWQLGHVPAEQYAIRAQQAAKMMKDVDPSIELVVCGTCMVDLPTYVEWDRQVLDHIGGLADYISLHRYVDNHADDTAEFLGVTNAIDHQIEEMDAVCRFAQAKRYRGRVVPTDRQRRAFLCFDEWNVWYKADNLNGAGAFAPPLIEERYNLEDALVVAGFFHSFLRRADVVKIANIAQLVNVIAPIQTRGDDLLIQSIFYVFEMFSKRGRGLSLQTSITGPTYSAGKYGEVRTVDLTALVDGDELHVFATNRSLDTSAPLEIALADGSIAKLVSAEIVNGTDPKAENSFEDPDVVTAKPFEQITVANGSASAQLPPLSVTAMTYELTSR